MKKFKKIASLVVAGAILTSSLAFTASVSAAEPDAAKSVDTAIQSNVQDGVILHAFNWSYNSIKENLPAIAAAGYSTIQTSPVQQAKDYGTSMDVSGQWWKLYQPVSMSIAQKSWLGTKDELKSLCEEADKYGIKIICDIVSNHMGNEVETDPNSISSQVETYQPDFYANKDTYFRASSFDASDSSVESVVRGHVSACPDLNTSNADVQNAVISLLKECIDCGVDGFRFDAAKHIETPDDGAYASDYWPNITSAAESYYTAKTGGDLYIYGEILNTCGANRKYSSYTQYINVTDNKTSDAVLYNVTKGNATSAANATYKAGVSAENVVLWAESHDTYEGTSGSGGLANTSKVDDSDIVKAWAIVASRDDATALYFARPGSALMGEAGTDTTYKSTAVSEINKFHNLFVGQLEKLGSSDGVSYVARGTSGIVLSNCNGNEKTVSISDTGLADGTYIDTITGNQFTVTGGVLSGSIGSTGVAVVYDGKTTPRNTCSVESGSFNGETMTVKLGLDNATSGTYCLDDSTPVTYTGEITIRIGSDYNYGDTINLTLTATDGSNVNSTVYKYTKKESSSSGVYVFFNPVKRTNWIAPFNVYIYDEDSNESETYSNASWPGEPMQYDEASGLYYYEVSANSCLAKDNVTEDVTDSTFDLAHSSNTCVIVSDSYSSSAGAHQYPSATAKTKLLLNGSSKIYGDTSTSSWTDTDLVPASAPVEPATEVVRDGSIIPTTPARLYGDVNNDGVINVLDATEVQKYCAELAVMPEGDLVICDVNEDGRLSVLDATSIQKYCAGLEGGGITGQVYNPVTPTTPTEQPTTAVQPTTNVPQPTTTPSSNYTMYLKTYLGWMTSDGVSLFAYDTETGESYQLIQDESAYPYVYTAEVPEEVSSVIVYRALDIVEEAPVASEAGPVYNAWSAVISKTNYCINLNNDETVSVGPYVEETRPDFELSRVYFDNSATRWNEVYIYGWGSSGLNSQTAPMTKIAGTDIYYYDFDEPILPGEECLIFKDTAGSTWVNQTNNLTVTENMNCYRANAGSKSGGTWYSYTES